MSLTNLFQIRAKILVSFVTTAPTCKDEEILPAMQPGKGRWGFHVERQKDRSLPLHCGLSAARLESILWLRMGGDILEGEDQEIDKSKRTEFWGRHRLITLIYEAGSLK